MRYVQVITEKDKIKRAQLEAIIIGEQAQKQLAQAKNAFLLSQVNPHFLFNTLNYIYYTTYKVSPIGGKAIMALSKLMRYSSNIEHIKDTIPLSLEIDYIETLIFLHQIRQKDGFNFKLECEENVKNVSVIPLLLITIAENIFKHGQLNHPNCSPYIKIYIESNNFLKILSGNMIRKNRDNQGLKIGLRNVKERVNIAYEGKANLNFGIRNSEEFFFELTIPVKNL